MLAEASIPPHQRDPRLTHFICIDLPCQPGGRYVVTSIVKANRSWKKRSRGPRNLERRLLCTCQGNMMMRQETEKVHGIMDSYKQESQQLDRGGRPGQKSPCLDCVAQDSLLVLLLLLVAYLRKRRKHSIPTIKKPSSIQQSVLANSRQLDDRTLNYVDWIPFG